MAVIVRRQGSHLGNLLRALDDARIPRAVPERGLSLTAEAATYPYPVLMTMAATDADLVYNMTRAMVELFDDYKAGAPGNLGWDIKRQIFAWAIPMHDGAIRYYKERGLWTAEHQKHNDTMIKRQDLLAAAWKAYLPTSPTDEKDFAKGWMKARADALTKAGLDIVVTEW